MVAGSFSSIESRSAGNNNDPGLPIRFTFPRPTHIEIIISQPSAPRLMHAQASELQMDRGPVVASPSDNEWRRREKEVDKVATKVVGGLHAGRPDMRITNQPFMRPLNDRDVFGR